ncbi:MULTISPECIES: alanyl-tRNA editing protein [unclassified Exiguobacterium]|uniref:alanine--tRNA ligase-related protein n=1 Tax=unclassified Exiguobacterium TaxID=2644629 RepID=UPI001BE7B66D|nr:MULTISPECIES: alanyl-tRNA editing protein [unclassified Exiguobacterium]
MRLEQIYPAVRKFVTRVTDVKEEHGYWVALEESYFYPESGGQPADRGTLNDLKVRDVQLKAGIVWHQVDQKIEGTVTGVIDDAVRTDHAAQHTAQHVISAILQDEFNIKTLSFRTGSEESTLDIEAGEWNDALQARLEKRLRHVITSALPITANEYDEAAALALPLRKTPQVTGKIRVVQIGELDYSACGGTHLESTADLELIILTGQERVRGNIRLMYVAKGRAFELLTKERRALREAAQLLSAKKEQLPQAVEELKQDVVRLNRMIETVQAAHVRTELNKLLASTEDWIFVNHADEALPFSERLVKAIAEAGRLGLIWNESAKKLLMQGSSPVHLGKFAKVHLKTFNGRGGGSEHVAQAMFNTHEDAVAYIERLKEEQVT